MQLRRLVLVIGLLFSTMLAISPAYAADERVWVTVSGTVWIDENVDGIRQPSEPILPGVLVNVHVSTRHYSRLTSGVRADDHGKYRYRVTTETIYTLYVYYTKPGVEVKKRPRTYTHYGCASFHVFPRQPEITLDIRMVLYGKDGVPPSNWPLVDGHFFKEASDYRGHCDAGFAVTNANGIPFWNTLKKLGVENVGYPISHRFVSEGFITQEFQKATFQWQTSRGIFRLEDYGNPLAIRTEKAVLQWRKNVPWGQAGQVKIMSGGRMGIDGVWLGSVPEDAKRPQHVDLAGLP